MKIKLINFKKRITLLLLITIVVGASSLDCTAQIKNTSNTLKLTSPENQQKASIESIKWLADYWVGEGMGAYCEETWNAPAANSMMGMFQMTKKDTVLFYELMQIIEENESLILKLKHFNSDLSAWEEKAETVDFPLIKIEGQTAWFDGLTYQRNKNELKVWVAIKQKDGSVEESLFLFKKKHNEPLKSDK